MDFYRTVFEVIDVGSFSSMWYWIALAVLWSTASRYVIGVPFDLALRALKEGGQKMIDVQDLVRINVNRILRIVEVTGLFSVALTSAGLTMLFVLGAFYGIEFAQAVFFLVFPMAIVALMNISTANKIHTGLLEGAAMVDALRKHRFKTQAIGMISIFVTAMWGMYKNIALGPFGGN